MDETVELRAQNHVRYKDSQDKSEYQALKRFFKGLCSTGKYYTIALRQNLFADLRDFIKRFLLRMAQSRIPENANSAFTVFAGN